MRAGQAGFVSSLQSAGAVPKLIRASKTFTGAANLGATGTNELFTTTGIVWLEWFSVHCSTTLVDAVDGATFTLGVTGTADAFHDAIADLDTIVTGSGLTNSGLRNGFGANLAANGNLADGNGGAELIDNIIMTISTQAITGGVLEFYILYRPLSSTGALALGAGMTAI